MIKQDPIRDTSSLPRLWDYSVMRKAVMALSGLALVVFVFGHWLGNRNLLGGEQTFYTYQAWLQNQPILHFGVWGLLILALVIHLAAGPQHWLHSLRARPVAYKKKQYQATNWAARSMMVSGSVLLLFIVIHVAQVRGFLVIESGGVYKNIQAGFEYWPILSIYLLGQIALAFHLYHGLWSFFQTLGLHHPFYNHWRRPFAITVSLGVAALNIGLILLNLDFMQEMLGAVS